MKNSTAVIENTDKIECTLQFTFTLEDWKQIKKTLNSNPRYIELQIVDEITSLVNQLEKTFYALAPEIP